MATYLVAIEDWRIDRGSDTNYSDLVLALQIYSQTGTPLEPLPVPEPSQFVLGGAVALLATAAYRRFRQRRVS